MSIGGGGCGETSAAMLISTLTGKEVLPTETMEWACSHGYVYANQGTSYDYFKPQFNQYNIPCEMLTWSKCLSAGSWVRYKVEEMLKDGYYFIALMKTGVWTKGGHYIVVWWEDDKIRINDPASKKPERLNGDPDTFYSQAKYFWWVDARAYNNGGDEVIDWNKAISELTDDQAIELDKRIQSAKATLPPSKYAVETCKKAIASGLFTDGNGDGSLDKPRCALTREEFATVLDRQGELDKAVRKK